MKTIRVETIEGIREEKIFEPHEINFREINFSAKEHHKKNLTYLDVVSAFDIETTNIFQRNKKGRISNEFRPYAFMYQWQFCIEDSVIFGRTWNDFLSLLQRIVREMDLDRNRRLVIWVMNLPYEFQFLKRFIDDLIIDSFCKDDHKPLKIVLSNGIEFRCAYALSNMSLSKFCKAENALHYKLVDTFDYNKLRTPSTPLTEEEEGYCYNDVRGLCECIRSRLKHDTIITIPMTSTGYVRRDFRNAMRKNIRNYYKFIDSQLDADLYTGLRLAFRGGNTHANALYSNQLLKKVSSHDIASSYPASMMINDYPITKFHRIKVSTYLNYDMSEYCQLLHVCFFNVRFIADHGIPYLAYSKCEKITSDRVIDNGRVLFASQVMMWCTEIDLEIIKADYKYDDLFYKEIYVSKKGKLNKEFRDTLKDYFVKKCTLKGIDDYMYNQSKSRLNGAYGMCVMRIDRETIKYENGEYTHAQNDLDEQLRKFYASRNNFLSYQHGVWVTAHSRARLEKFLQTISAKDTIYVDTDSCKFLGDHEKEIERLNDHLRSEAERNNADVEAQGKHYHMGVWENETPKPYQFFKTLGAKKYCYQKDSSNIIHSTIAGVGKNRGEDFFTKNGFGAFAVGTVIENSGHLVAYRNDDSIHYIEINGEKILTASNLALIDDTYTIGVSDDYAEILDRVEQGIDILPYL